MTSSTSRPALRKGVIGEAARASDSYGLLLVLVAMDYVTLSAGWTNGEPAILVTVLVGLTALLAFHTSHVRGRLLRAVQVGAALAVVASIVAVIDGGDVARGVVYSVSALLILTSPVVVLSRILRHPQVTAETLLGAICVYILLGLVFSYSDYAIQLVGGHPFFSQPGTHNAPDFVYYSYITMTTVGYGDLSPAVGLPRTMAVIEALTGQIFLVVLVARLVAMYQPTTRGARLRRLEESTDAKTVEEESSAGSLSGSGTPAEDIPASGSDGVSDAPA